MDNELTPRSDEFGLARADQSKAPITNQESASFAKQLLGFWVTFRTMFKKVNTVQYPEVKEPTAPRFHGRPSNGAAVKRIRRLFNKNTGLC